MTNSWRNKPIEDEAPKEAAPPDAKCRHCGKPRGGHYALTDGCNRSPTFFVPESIEMTKLADAYKRIKEENDERYIIERDSARHLLEEMTKERDGHRLMVECSEKRGNELESQLAEMTKRAEAAEYEGRAALRTIEGLQSMLSTTESKNQGWTDCLASAETTIAAVTADVRAYVITIDAWFKPAGAPAEPTAEERCAWLAAASVERDALRGEVADVRRKWGKDSFEVDRLRAEMVSIAERQREKCRSWVDASGDQTAKHFGAVVDSCPLVIDAPNADSEPTAACPECGYRDGMHRGTLPREESVKCALCGRWCRKSLPAMAGDVIASRDGGNAGLAGGDLLDEWDDARCEGIPTIGDVEKRMVAAIKRRNGRIRELEAKYRDLAEEHDAARTGLEYRSCLSRRR